MKKSYTKGLMLMLLSLPTLGGYAQSAGSEYNVINTAVPFLTVTPDARGAGYGDQGAATTADNSSQFYNAAKYIWSKNKGGVAYSFTPWLRKLNADMNLNYLAGYYKFDDKQAVSASFRYFAMGELPLTDENGSVLKNYSPNEFALDAAYSRLLAPNLSASIAFRYIRSNITGDAVEGAKSGSSFATDLGVYYQKSINNNVLAAGASISNIGSKISYGTEGAKGYLPTNLRVGVRYTFSINEENSLSALLETTKLLVPTPNVDSANVNLNADKSAVGGIFSSFTDAPGGFSEEIKEFTYSLGTEYAFKNMVMLRGGYYHQAKMKGNNQFFTVGLGLRYQFANLDFSYLIPASDGASNPLANTFRFTVGLNF